MKKNNFIKHILVALTFAAAIAVMVPATGSVEAQAARKIISQQNWKNAPAVKPGTTIVTTKKAGKSTAKWIKFKANRTGTYKFTVSNLRPSVETNCGNFTFYKDPSKGLALVNLKTEGGYTSSFHIASKKFMKYYNPGLTAKKDRYRLSRSVTTKMTKGQIIYMQFYYTSAKKYTYTLNIKRIK